MRYLTYSALVHGLLAAALLMWAPAALKSAAPGIVRVLLLAGNGEPEAEAPVAAAAANPDPASGRNARRAETRPKPAAAGAARVSLVGEAQTRESAPPSGPGLRLTEGPARIARLASRARLPDSEEAGATGAERDRRIALIQARIQQALFYPRPARRRGIEGTVHVRFGIRQDGRVDGLAVARSSGHRLLDRASVKTIERAQPFPFIDGALEVPVVFRLSDGR